MRDDYRTVTVRLRSVQPNVITADRPATRGGGICTIPRSLLHGSDDLALNRITRVDDHESMTLRLRDWKAEELGFA